MGQWMKIEYKRAVIKKAKASPEMTQGALAAWVTREYKLRNKPARNTISDVLKNAAAILSDSYGDGSRRKPLQVISPTLETQLASWIESVEQRNVCLSRELITMKARELQARLCDAWDLNFSVGWLTGFMKRHGLRYRPRHGEAGSGDPKVIQEGLRKVQQVTDLYDAENIYNMDETGLCYAMAPTRSICSKRMRGVKKNKTRITLAVTSNADGSDALPILFLGRAKNPRCFKKKSAEQLGFDYHANEKAWMTRKVYQSWVRGVDRDMRAAGRHILLLLDNASSHQTGDLHLTNVTIEHLPPNTTAFLQPMDAGIIASFKAGYKKKQLRWAFDKLRDPETLTKNPYRVDQLQAMRWSDEVWQDIKQKKTITNCFRHTNICYLEPKDNSDDAAACSYGDDVEVSDVMLRLATMQI